MDKYRGHSERDRLIADRKERRERRERPWLVVNEQDVIVWDGDGDPLSREQASAVAAYARVRYPEESFRVVRDGAPLNPPIR